MFWCPADSAWGGTAHRESGIGTSFSSGLHNGLNEPGGSNIINVHVQARIWLARKNSTHGSKTCWKKVKKEKRNRNWEACFARFCYLKVLVEKECRPRTRVWNFGEISPKKFVFASYREKKFGIFWKISVLKFKIQKKSDKIHRNFGTEFRYRRSPGFGKKTEIVNPAEDTMTKTWS